MAQRSKQRQPVYSADTLALRYLGGLILVALGVLMFLAVVLKTAGNVFDVLRQVCFGLTGGLAAAAPLFPVWAGVLVIWSCQRKAPVRPFLYGVLAYLGLCAFVVLVTRYGNEEYLQLLSRLSDGSWGGVIYQGYAQSISLQASGGALGVILAYPFWSLVGTILGAVLLFVLILVCALLAVGLTPGRIRGLMKGQVSFSFGRKKNDQEGQDRQQIAYQQEQERQRQAYAQQQAYLMQQQYQLQQQQNRQQAREAAARQQSGRWNRQNQENAWPGASGIPAWPETAQGKTASEGADSVAEWQQQLTDRMTPVEPGQRSRIFDRQTGEDSREGASGSRIFGLGGSSGRSEEKSAGSRIFGRKKQDDGLSALSPEEKRREGMAYPRTSFAQSGNTGRMKSARIRMEQAQIEEDLSRWKEPEQGAAPEPEREQPARENRLPEREPEAPERPLGREEAPGDSARTGAQRRTAGGGGKASSSWMDQVISAEEESRNPGREERKTAAKDSRTGEGTGKPKEPEQISEPAARESCGDSARKPEQLTIPVVQETIKDPTWKPELRHVNPKEEDPAEEYWEPTPYYAPPITDLKKPDAAVLDTSLEDEERSRRLEATLQSFKVQARVVHVTHGPAISRFELELAPGTKVGKISELEKDIAYGMQATSVRIEAPIPGKGLVGVEVPNPKRATVTLREVLESSPMQNAKSILTVALGKDIAGAPVVCDLARMPHLLIAGATGSGKSVCINTIINSLLFRAGPDEVRMILVDPKVVELQCYNGIPHLLLPVVNDPHKAAAALAWAVAEMMERYDKFSERGVRNLEGYNGILAEGEKPMPRIVIIIDELADLMMVCKKDVEEYICRLTQLARAAGIHLIVATQRPSVDVITGLIKANIPSRIAFKTASYVDSRTILDRNGSEQLLGWGDMLYLPTGSFAPTRVQGCFLSDEEVNRIADHVRQANPSAYDPEVLDKLEQLSRGQEDQPGMDMIGGAAESESSDSGLFEQAVEYAISDGQISTSTLQRRLKVGYARAGRLTDELEARGIISAKDGSKPRKCLITREQWEQMKTETPA